MFQTSYCYWTSFMFENWDRQDKIGARYECITVEQIMIEKDDANDNKKIWKKEYFEIVILVSCYD